MNKLYIPIVFGLLCYNQSIPVNKTELRQIFKVLSEEDLTKTKYFIIDSIEQFDTKAIKQSGIKYFIAEPDDLKKGIWTNEIFDSAKIVPLNYLDSISKKDSFDRMPAHYSFSLPYFSKDKSSFIIYYNSYCGNLCAEYSLRLYNKINGKWKFIKTYFRVVS